MLSQLAQQQTQARLRHREQLEELGVLRRARVQLLRHDGTRLDLTVEQSLGGFNLRNGDALFVEDNSWWLRNQRQITVAAAVSTIVASIVSIIIVLSR